MKTSTLLSGAALSLALIGCAQAADLPGRGPVVAPPVYAPMFTWTGFYTGTQGGGMATKLSTNGVIGVGHSDPGAWGASHSFTQVFAGGHLGYDYQWDRFVVGVEADANGRFGEGDPAFARRASDNFVSSDYATGWRSKASWDASVRLRAGYLVTERALVYITGGIAWSDFELNHGGIGSEVEPALAATWGLANIYGGTRTGWTFGGGTQYALDPNWSMRVEYRYTDYGSESVAWGDRSNWSKSRVLQAGDATTKIKDNRVSVGLSYKFGGWAEPDPVLARF